MVLGATGTPLGHHLGEIPVREVCSRDTNGRTKYDDFGIEMAALEELVEAFFAAGRYGAA
jgi:hypothetical protein